MGKAISRKIKILMLLKSPVYNDSRVIKEANSLMEAGYDVVVLFSSGEIKDFDFKFKIKRIIGTKKSDSVFLKLFKNILIIFKMINLGIKSKPDICHCHDLNTLLDGYIISLFCNSKIDYPK
jgi:hypothetical protein